MVTKQVWNVMIHFISLSIPLPRPFHSLIYSITPYQTDPRGVDICLKQHDEQEDEENEDFPSEVVELRRFCEDSATIGTAVRILARPCQSED
ncbi:hypothetical protein Hanom_Chr07g00626821 [Helianthus anomalus]